MKQSKKLEEVLISKKILFKKIVAMHGKAKLTKIKASIRNTPKEVGNMQYLGPAVSNGLIVVKLKQILEYRDHVGFEIHKPSTHLFKIS